MIMRDLTQKLDYFYSAAATGNTREQVALNACRIILGALSSCASAVDPRTGEFLPMSMLELAGRISATITDSNGRNIDRIGFMADFLQDAICGIISNPREEIVRTHQMLPLQRAKSFDQTSIRWLIRRSGESIAQKCALARRVMTVKREFVPDTLENRLFKEFVRQFIPLLQRFIADVRDNGIAQSETQLLVLMKKWLREHSEDIKPWRNLPPNNTLLGDKNYRKIWDSWRRLTDFPDTLSSDVSSTAFYRQQILFLCIINQLQEFGVRFAPVPAKMNLFHGKFDRGGKLEFADHEIHGIYINDFNKIVPLTLACNDCILIRVSSRIINIRIDDINHINVDGRVFRCVGLDFLTFINDLIPKIIIGAKLQKVPVQEDHSTANQEHISVDLNNGRPTFYSNGEKVRYSSLFIARQYWNFSGEIFSLPLKEAKACICSDHCETRVVSDFWHDEYAMADVSRTAADFARDIYSSLPLKECDHTLLLPDMLDEMSDSARILKRALDAEDTGHRADWLPTCIAALFAVLRKSPDAKKEGQTFCFLERFGNTYSITSVMARKPSFSEELGASVPESCGLIWERHPSFKKSIDDNDTPARQFDHFKTLAPFPVLGEKGQWTRPGSVKSQEIIVSEVDLRQSLQIAPWKCRFILLSPGIMLPRQYHAEYLTRADLVKGAEILHTMQQKGPQYPLWTDDLPKLLVTAHRRDNKLETRPLVSDDHEPVKTVRGQRTKLTTDEIRFILHQGQKESYVDLQRGEGQKKESYRVRLHLQRAPEENIICKLNLYYTFGAANPYSLEFTPIDPCKAGFVSIEGEPQRFTDDSNAFAAPEFPPLAGWDIPANEQQELNQGIDKFHKFWVRNLEDFEYFASFDSAQEIINTQVAISFVGHAGKKSIPVRTYDFARNEDGRSIMCHMDSFTGGAEEFATRTDIPTWYALVGNPSGRNLSAKAVSATPLNIDALRNPALFGKSYLRGRLKNLTRNGRRPFTSSVPEKLKKVLSDTGCRIMELLKRPYMPYQQKQMLVETLAAYGVFQPEGFGEWLLDKFSAGATFSSVAIGYAIGDLQQIWQRQLWELVLGKWRYGNDTSFISPVTGIAISRYDEVLQAIPPKTAKIILDDISARLKVCCEQIKRNMKPHPLSGENDEAQMIAKKNTDQNKHLCRNQLQFLLSMLRLRKSEDETVKNILHPSASITRKLQNDIQDLMLLNLHDLTVRVQGEEKNLLDEVYGFLTGAQQDEFMELDVSDDGEGTPDEE